MSPKISSSDGSSPIGDDGCIEESAEVLSAFSLRKSTNEIAKIHGIVTKEKNFTDLVAYVTSMKRKPSLS